MRNDIQKISLKKKEEDNWKSLIYHSFNLMKTPRNLLNNKNK